MEPSGYYMYRTVVTICTTRFNIQQFYVLPTQLYLCVLCGSENKQRLFPFTALTGLYNRDLTLCTPVVTICTTRFNIQQSYVLPTQLYLCFVWISEQTAIISLYNINWLIFITETESVYCAVRTESVTLF